MCVSDQGDVGQPTQAAGHAWQWLWHLILGLAYGTEKDENSGWRPWSDGIRTEVGDASGEGLESMEWALWGKETRCNMGVLFQSRRGLGGDGLSVTELPY